MPLESGAAPRRRATIKDVAKVAHVAPSTVSKALNNAHEIPEDTRRRVREAADLIGYRPNALARSLRMGSSRTIGAVTDDIEGVFSTLIVRGLEHHAQERGYTIFLSNSLGERERERRDIEAFIDKQVDGLVIMDAVVHPRGPAAADTRDTPVVYVYCYPADLDAPSIVPDDEGAGEVLTAHLLSTGRRHIAFLSGPRVGPGAFEASAHRLEGYLKAHAAAGLVPDAASIRYIEWDARSGYQGMAELLGSGAEIDSVVCANDYIAVGAIEAIRLAGLGVPDDIAVAGFDNRAISSGLSVPLTTMAVDHEEMGRLAVRQIFAALDGLATTAGRITVPSRLVIRESTARPGIPSTTSGSSE